jgi:hypothetical protein
MFKHITIGLFEAYETLKNIGNNFIRPFRAIWFDQKDPCLCSK